MPSRRRQTRPNTRNNSRRTNSRRGTTPAVSVLRDVRQNIRDQSIRPVPSLPDVMPMKFRRDQVVNITLGWDVTNLTSSLSTVTAGGFYCALSALAGYADWAACFDAYKIVQIRMYFQPNSTLVSGVPIQTAIDYDDYAAPGAGALEQYESFQTVPFGQYFERTFNPRIAIAAYSGAFTSFANQRAGWLDMASPNVQHYGIKYFIPIALSVQTMTVTAQVHCQFRYQR